MGRTKSSRAATAKVRKKTPFIAFAPLITRVATIAYSAGTQGRRQQHLAEEHVTAFAVALLAGYGAIALGRGLLFPDHLALSTIWAMASSYNRYHYVGQLLLAVLL